jgi:hypothetical protein
LTRSSGIRVARPDALLLSARQRALDHLMPGVAHPVE